MQLCVFGINVIKCGGIISTARWWQNTTAGWIDWSRTNWMDNSQHSHAEFWNLKPLLFWKCTDECVVKAQTQLCNYIKLGTASLHLQRPDITSFTDIYSRSPPPAALQVEFLLFEALVSHHWSKPVNSPGHITLIAQHTIKGKKKEKGNCPSAWRGNGTITTPRVSHRLFSSLLSSQRLHVAKQIWAVTQFCLWQNHLAFQASDQVNASDNVSGRSDSEVPGAAQQCERWPQSCTFYSSRSVLFVPLWSWKFSTCVSMTVSRQK